MNGLAFISDCKTWRYWPTRRWDDSLGELVFCMLNPSIADAVTDDPTVTRCIERAKRLGYGKLIVVNLFAMISTDPRHLQHASDPVGPLNDVVLDVVAKTPSSIKVVCAWGVHGNICDGRAHQVLTRFKAANKPLHVLKLSKSGMPCHPLYLPYDLAPIPWNPEV